MPVYLIQFLWGSLDIYEHLGSMASVTGSILASTFCLSCMQHVYLVHLNVFFVILCKLMHVRITQPRGFALHRSVPQSPEAGCWKSSFTFTKWSLRAFSFCFHVCPWFTPPPAQTSEHNSVLLPCYSNAVEKPWLFRCNICPGSYGDTGQSIQCLRRVFECREMSFMPGLATPPL